MLSQIDIDTGIGKLDKLNSPGLMLCLCWSLFSVLVLTMYTDLDILANNSRIQSQMAALDTSTTDPCNVDMSEATPLLYTEVTSYQTHAALSSDMSTVQSQDLTSYNSRTGSPVKLSDVQNYASSGTAGVRRPDWKYRKVQRSDSTVSGKSNNLIYQAERLMRDDSDVDSEYSPEYSEVESNNGDIENYQGSIQTNNNNEEEAIRTKDYIRVLLSENLICLTYLRFVALFCQTCLESTVPPIMEKYFDYGDQANSILYLLAGVQLIIVFGILNMTSRYISDRVLISVGILLMMSALTWLVVTLPTFHTSDRSNLPYFAVGVILDLAGIPTVCDIGLSLYSKLTPDSMQV